MKHSARLLFFVFLATIPMLSVNAAIMRTLIFGANGSDVKELQIVLNSDPFTQIADDGPGSPGQETEYFGGLTQKAVMNFQRKYAPEVLFPAGIWQPTGIVGSFTRAKLNKLAVAAISPSVTFGSGIPTSIQNIVPIATTTPLVVASPTSQYQAGIDFQRILLSGSKPLLFSLSRYEAKHGDSVTVNGSGFLSTGNSVLVGSNYRIDNIPSANGTTTTFVVPNDLPNGSYNLSIENKNGTTFNASYGSYFKVTDNPIGPPTITKVEPSAIPSTDTKFTITITGENFDGVNDIISSLGNLSDVSSDGKTMTFSLMSLPNTKTLIDNVKIHPISFPVYVYVKNSHGVTQTPQKVILDFK